MSATDAADHPKRYATYQQALTEREEHHRFRSLTPLPADSDVLNFCSNDYLGLAKDRDIKVEAIRFVETWGNGATASRLVSGTFDIHKEVEERLAAFTHRERALVFNSGYQANATIIPVITDRKTLILADKRAHNSLLFGCMASRGRLLRFAHNDTEDLQRLIDKFGDQHDSLLIVSESVFSMDGDRAPLSELCEVAEINDALLYIDDAHAMGILGEEGRGLAAEHDRIDWLIGTFGKAFGASGAFVSAKSTLIDYLINFCAGFIYTTGLPPATLGAISGALDWIPKMDQRREHVAFLTTQLRNALQEMGWETAGSESQIVPAVIGSDRKAVECSQYLSHQGILCSAIRPPTVPEGTARLRFTITADHTERDLEKLITALKTFKGV
jgi:8-amino-7-oxononanoate synthase